MSKGKSYIGVIDEGTGLARFVVFEAENPTAVASHEVPVNSRTPHEGWVEQDPEECLDAIRTCITHVLSSLKGKGISVSDIVAIGITNQRETTVVWNPHTGKPLYNAIVWSDIRTHSVVDAVLARTPGNDPNYLKPICGLPISPYFSAFKIRWLIENVPTVRKSVDRKQCLVGTMDSWLIWNLTGGKNGGLHITDVTNASRTMLMNIDSLQWDPVLCSFFRIPSSILPTICSSSEIYGHITEEPLNGIPISGILGDQQAALVGEGCLQPGATKNTYHDACFLVCNTGTARVNSAHGIVTTIAYRIGKSSPVYALEGTVAVAGSAFRWLKNNLNLIKDESDIEKLSESVPSTGDVYFVPAFSGLYAPYWRMDARGILCGLTQFTTKAHIVRAALEAVCFQTRDILEAMKTDCGIPIKKLQVDGKLTSNNLMLQLQADVCGVTVEKCSTDDVRALGAARMAGQAEGIEVWNVNNETAQPTFQTFEPNATEKERDHRYSKWKMAVQRSLGWATTKKSIAMTDERYRLLASIPGSWFLILSFGMLVLSRELSE